MQIIFSLKSILILTIKIINRCCALMLECFYLWRGGKKKLCCEILSQLLSVNIEIKNYTEAAFLVFLKAL